jgi:hypothetical protein
MKKIVIFFSIYNLISILLIFIFFNYFKVIYFGTDKYLTFFGLFWYTPFGGPDFLKGLRVTGFCWEPGIWQWFLNLSLLISFHENKKYLFILLNLISASLVLSTTGLINTLLIIVYGLFIVKKFKLNYISVLLFSILFIILSPIIIDNFQDKLFGKNSISGMARVSDIITGFELVRNNLLLGTDPDLSSSINNYKLFSLKKQLWNGNFKDGSIIGYLLVKNSNGIVIFILDWGLPFATFLLFSGFKSPFFRNIPNFSILFWVTLFITMFAEAISRTGLFYFFILSGLINLKFKSC